MSALKNRIRLQQAQTELERGLITQEAYDQIEADCTTTIPGVQVQMAGSPGEGIQLGPADLPPVATSSKRKKASTATPVAAATPETTPEPGNA